MKISTFIFLPQMQKQWIFFEFNLTWGYKHTKFDVLTLNIFTRMKNTQKFFLSTFLCSFLFLSLYNIWEIGVNCFSEMFYVSPSNSYRQQFFMLFRFSSKWFSCSFVEFRINWINYFHNIFAFDWILIMNFFFARNDSSPFAFCLLSEKSLIEEISLKNFTHVEQLFSNHFPFKKSIFSLLLLTFSESRFMNIWAMKSFSILFFHFIPPKKSN